MPGKKIRLPAGTLLIVLVCLVVYIPAFRGGFVWDDDTTLTKNLIIQDNSLYQSWFTAKQSNYWPITWTSYWLEHKLWGLNPAGYHITNILIHTACTLLIWRILIQLNIPGAFAAALIFAVHPVNVESVAWIAQRKTILAMLFFLLSLLFYLRFDQTGQRIFYALSAALFIPAMLSKGSVVALPVVLLLCVWWLHRTITKRDIIRSIPFFVVSAVMSVVEIWFQYNRAIGEDVVRSDSFLSRLAGAGWAVWFYLYKAILPIHLTFIYPRWKIDPANWVSYVPGLLLVILPALSWRYRRSWGRAVFFAAGYYIVMLFPVLGFFNIYFMRYSFVADHYQYVSIISVIAFIVAAVYRFAGQFGLSRKAVLPAAFIIVSTVMGILAWRQGHIYRNIETLWRDTITKDPNSWMAHYNLGVTLKEQGKLDEAISHYQRALLTKPDFIEAYDNLAVALAQQNRLDEAIACCLQALRIKPDSSGAYCNLGIILGKYGRLDDAVGHFRQALKLKPDYADACYNLGKVLQLQGKLDEAADYYRQAIKLNPNFAKAHNNLGTVLGIQGRSPEAISHFQEALRLKPDYTEARLNLDKALQSQTNPQ
jgi:tetratricopeptide (TPR) repeat protein